MQEEKKNPGLTHNLMLEDRRSLTVSGILYDSFRALRMMISGSKLFVVFMDILYYVVCGFLIFCFSLAADYGRIRMFSLAGNALGWMIYYFSFGTIAMRITSLISGAFLSVKRG